MLWSGVLATSDADEFQAAIRPATEALTVTGRGRFSASLTRVELHNVRMQRFRESLSRAWELRVPPTRSAIAFVISQGPAIGWRGTDIAAHEFVPLRAGGYGWHVLHGETQWGSMSLPDECLTEASIALMGRDVTPRRDAVALAAPPLALQRLLRLHAAAGQLAETAPEIIENSDAARGLEQVLTEAMLACLDATGAREDRAARRRHAAIIRRFCAYAETRAGQALYLMEVCKAIGVTERTLLHCCQEQLGTSPKRYLLLRRLHLARRDLRAANPAMSSVTEIATRYGFWELGWFAVHYKLAFGESPSATLRCARAPAERFRADVAAGSEFLAGIA